MRVCVCSSDSFSLIKNVNFDEIKIHVSRNVLVNMISRDRNNHGISVTLPNMPMQYAMSFKGCENDNILNEKNDIFLSFNRKMDCGNTLEPPQRGLRQF